jgi:iron-sulfur cluster repair protein YtfE (RIC family)
MYGIASRPAVDDPVELLAAAHGRIDAQLDALESLAERVGTHGADAQARDAARFIMHYFDTAGVQHQRDEDEDWFPLLRRLAGDCGRPEISAVINEIEGQHATLDELWSRLRERLNSVALAREARLDIEEVTRFAWLYRRHLGAESASLLPFAKEVLTAQQRARLGKSMAARRARSA